jgi:shikimate kinase
MTPEADRHLVLVGLMGAGKTSVGRACAARIGRAFVDTDELIEATSGHTVAQIFATDGEPAFRALERRAVTDVCAAPDALVIACGGGAVLDAENRRRLRASGLVVWLRTSPAVLAARVGDSTSTRPLLRSGEPERELERLAEMRAAAYESAAHVTIDTDTRDVEQVADAILEELARCRV